MLDIHVFRDAPDRIRADLAKRKMDDSIVSDILRMDEDWRGIKFEVDQLRKKRNSSARMIAAAKKSGDVDAVERTLEEVQSLGSAIEEMESKASSMMKKRDSLRMQVPNLLHEDVPIGENDEKNVEINRHGEPPEFGFDPRTHNEIIEKNGWVDLTRGAKVSGSRQYFLIGDLARLEMALQQYSTDFLTDRGYTLIQPPLMMNRKSYEGVTDLSDFENVMYGIDPKLKSSQLSTDNNFYVQQN